MMKILYARRGVIKIYRHFVEEFEKNFLLNFLLKGFY